MTKTSLKTKVLYENQQAYERSCNFAKVVEINGKRFKITNDTGNAYSNTRIYVQTPDLTWVAIANEYDLAGTPRIQYHDYIVNKNEQMANIYKLSVEYIKKVCF